MSFDLKEDLKEMLPEYMKLLEEQGYTESRGRDYWNCPLCGSGTGDNGTAAFHIISGYNGMKYNCFSCGEKGDIFDLVAKMEHLEKANFKERYNRTVKIMRPYVEGNKPVQIRHETSVEKQEEDVDYTDYLLECHGNVHKTRFFIKRGLSSEIVERFKLGYDPKKNIATIPYNLDYKGYVHRALWNAERKYRKHGNYIFNMKALYSAGEFVFITEGELDAISLEEIGCTAVGMGGVNEIAKLVTQLKQNPCKKMLILALDNDNAGRKATGRLIEELAEQEIDCDYAVVSNLYGRHKDANEYLVADRTGFERKVKNLVRCFKSSIFYNGN